VTIKNKDGRVKKAVPTDKALEMMKDYRLFIDSNKTE